MEERVARIPANAKRYPIQLAISDFIALAIALGVIAAGVLYYYLVMPKLKYATKGIATVDIPEIREERNADGKKGTLNLRSSSGLFFLKIIKATLTRL